MSDYQVTKIEFLNTDKVDDRECICTLNNGTQIHICACHESWEQWGGTTSELWSTVYIAEYINDWLHGEGECPDEEYLMSLGYCEEYEEDYQI